MMTIVKRLEKRLRKPPNDVCAMPVENIAAYMVCRCGSKNVTAYAVPPVKAPPAWNPYTSRKQREYKRLQIRSPFIWNVFDNEIPDMI